MVLKKPSKRRKPARLRKTRYLRVRVTAALDKAIRNAAQRAQIPVSSWVTQRLVRAAREAGEDV